MITLDVDGVTRDEATAKMLMAYINLKYVYPRRDVFVHLTRRGYHLIVYGNDGDLERERELRRVFGDDPFRVDIDKHKQEIGSYNFNVLWTVKRGFEVKEINPLSLDVVNFEQFPKFGDECARRQVGTTSVRRVM